MYSKLVWFVLCCEKILANSYVLLDNMAALFFEQVENHCTFGINCIFQLKHFFLMFQSLFARFITNDTAVDPGQPQGVVCGQSPRLVLAVVL